MKSTRLRFFLKFLPMALLLFNCDIDALLDELNPCVDECYDGTFAEALLGGACSADCDCDGLRTCNLSTGYCTGTARDCSTFDGASCEQVNNSCTQGCTDSSASNYNSDAAIEDGSCEFTAISDCIDPCYSFDEATINLYCTTDCDCDGMRTCSFWSGYCEGTSRNCDTMNETTCSDSSPCQ